MPTIAETVLPGFDEGGHHGIVVPAGVPREIVARLHQGLVMVLQSPDIRERLAAEGSEVVGNAPEQYGAMMTFRHCEMGKSDSAHRHTRELNKLIISNTYEHSPRVIAMFDKERFIEDCRAAVKESNAHAAIRELVAKAVREPAQLLKVIGEPARAGVETYYKADDLTMLNLCWGPQMVFKPHDHRMWAVIGIYGGRGNVSTGATGTG